MRITTGHVHHLFLQDGHKAQCKRPPAVAGHDGGDHGHPQQGWDTTAGTTDNHGRAGAPAGTGLQTPGNISHCPAGGRLDKLILTDRSHPRALNTRLWQGSSISALRASTRYLLQYM